MARRGSLAVLTEVAEDATAALAAIARLRAGTNGAAVALLVRALERELRRVVAFTLRRKRKAAAKPRDVRGRFLGGIFK